MTELKVTASKGPGFYLRAAQNFLQGMPDKPPVAELRITGVGEAVGTAATVAALIEARGWAEVMRIETSTLEVPVGYAGVGGSGQRHLPKLVATVSPPWPYPDPCSYCNFDEVVMLHYALDLEIDFKEGVLRGHTEMSFRGVAASSSRIVLDTRDLKISSVEEVAAGGSTSPLQYTIGTEGRSSAALGQALEVTLAKPVAAGQEVKVRIAYVTSSEAEAMQILAPEQTIGRQHPYFFTQCQSIHARTLMPCQDTPGVKSTYEAKVTAPAPLTVLMSAVRVDEAPKEVGDGKRCFSFTQKVPIPSYLLAIASGHLDSRRIGPRSHVWSEPEAVEACAFEFSETETFLKTAEDLYGEYQWSQYDLLVLPPSFPFGGMENPCLTFVTPTVLAGDRSLADVVAHEIAHSWFGNLCTNKSWECFWLNEGFTTFAETRIMETSHKSAAYGELMNRNHLSDLIEAVESFGAGHEYTKLCPRVRGVDPDDAFSSIPYNKGQFFLLHLEQLVGRERFGEYMKAHVKNFAGRCFTEVDFKEFFLKHFAGEAAIANVNWDKWLYGTGLPEIPPISSPLADAVEALSKKLLSGQHEASAEDLAGWFPAQTQMLLQQLVEHCRHKADSAARKEILGRLGAWSKAYGFDATRNSELRFRWLSLALLCGDDSRVDAAIAMAKEVGRMKFTRPLYKELAQEPRWRERAKATFEEVRSSYHPITAKMVAQDFAANS